MAWSFSKLKSYETCPLQYLEVNVLKHYQQKEHPTTTWGIRGHLALEERVRDGKALPEEFSYLEGFAQRISEIPGHTFCEHELACTQEKSPTSFDSPDAWARGIIDVFKFRDNEALAIDYKFGKVKPTSQLKLMALLVFANYPTVQKCDTRFLWIAHREKTEAVFYRKDMDSLWVEFEESAGQLAKAHEEGVFKPKSSGLCKAHCPVASCEYFGRGNRRY